MSNVKMLNMCTFFTGIIDNLTKKKYLYLRKYVGTYAIGRVAPKTKFVF